MKIVIQRTKSFSSSHGAHDDSVGYLRSILMGLNHHGWMKDVHMTKSSRNEDTITVTMLPQGDINPVDLALEVRQTIASHTDLKLVSIEGVRNRKKLPGLLFLSKSPEDAVTFIVDPAYALFLASDVARAANCTKPEVYELNFMYEESEHQPDVYEYTGTACILSHKAFHVGLKNPYNRFAQMIVQNSNIRQKILNDLVVDIRFTLQPNGSCSLDYFQKNETAVVSPTLH